MLFDDLSPELRQKAASCKTNEELAELAKQEGFELSEEMLDAISGGESWAEYVAKECPGFYACGDHCGIYRHYFGGCGVDCTWAGGMEPSGNSCDQFNV